MIFINTIEEFLRPYEQLARLCGMHYINPFLVQGYNTMPATQIEQHAHEYYQLFHLHLQRVRKFGFKVFDGDVTRLGLLRAAEADKAHIIVLAMDDRDAILVTIDTIQSHFPRLKIVARAWKMVHAYQLLDRGVELFERETFDSALLLGERALQQLGFRNY